MKPKDHVITEENDIEASKIDDTTKSTILRDSLTPFPTNDDNEKGETPHTKTAVGKSDEGARVKNKAYSRLKATCVCFALSNLIFFGVIALFFPMFYQAFNLTGSMNANDYSFSEEDVQIQEIPLNEINMTNPFNMAEMTKLAAYPAGMTINYSFMKPFTFTLSDEFLKEGDPQLTMVEGYYDDESLKSIKFRFYNGNSTMDSPQYGITSRTELSKLTKQTKRVPRETGIVQSLSYFYNHTAPVNQFGGSNFATIYFSVN